MSEPKPGHLRVVTVEDTCPDCRGVVIVIPAAGLVEPTHDESCPTKQLPANLQGILDAIDHDPRTRQAPITDEDEQHDEKEQGK